MTEAIEVALIAAVPPTLVALGALILGVLNRLGLANVSLKIDGRLTELLELTRKASHAEGVREQKQEEESLPHKVRVPDERK
jgi:hypothetical protein